MKIAFLGTPSFVQPIKEKLSKHFTLVDSLKDADLGVIAAFGKILTKDELNAPKYGCINIHPSLLPKYRGASPIQSAILNGDSQTGVSIIKMDEQVDHGVILYQSTLELSENDNFDILSNKLFHLAKEVLPKVITDFVEGKITPTPQDDSQASFCNLLTKDTGYFDINTPPDFQKLDRMIRAYYPWPGVWTKWRSSTGVSKIVKFLPDKKLQMEGKKPISFKDFLNGYPDFPILLQ
jgi:methionyl-tRNA formyltransferase